MDSLLLKITNKVRDIFSHSKYNRIINIKERHHQTLFYRWDLNIYVFIYLYYYWVYSTKKNFRDTYWPLINHPKIVRSRKWGHIKLLFLKCIPFTPSIKTFSRAAPVSFTHTQNPVSGSVSHFVFSDFQASWAADALPWQPLIARHLWCSRLQSTK